MRRTGVAAALVACSLFVGCSAEPSDEPSGSISPPLADEVVEPVETTLADLPQGTPPKIGYAERNT